MTESDLVLLAKLTAAVVGLLVLALAIWTWPGKARVVLRDPLGAAVSAPRRTTPDPFGLALAVLWAGAMVGAAVDGAWMFAVFNAAGLTWTSATLWNDWRGVSR